MTDKTEMTVKNLPPVHPGEVLLGELLKPLGISQNRLARETHLLDRVNRDVLGNEALGELSV